MCQLIDNKSNDGTFCKSECSTQTNNCRVPSHTRCTSSSWNSHQSRALCSGPVCWCYRNHVCVCLKSITTHSHTQWVTLYEEGSVEWEKCIREWNVVVTLGKVKDFKVQWNDGDLLEVPHHTVHPNSTENSVQLVNDRFILLLLLHSSSFRFVLEKFDSFVKISQVLDWQCECYYRTLVKCGKERKCQDTWDVNGVHNTTFELLKSIFQVNSFMSEVLFQEPKYF